MKKQRIFALAILSSVNDWPCDKSIYSSDQWHDPKPKGLRRPDERRTCRSQRGLKIL